MKTDVNLKKKWMEEQATLEFDDESLDEEAENWKRSKPNEECSDRCQFIFPRDGGRDRV